MPAYLKKSETEILQDQLTKIVRNTPLSATGPGSIVRSLAAAVANQLGDLYDALDYNVNQTLVTTATGAALDYLGSVYNVQRKQVNELAALDKRLGAFLFYVSAPHNQDIFIPKGTNIYSSTNTYMGQRFSYKTIEDTVIPAGRTRAYASIEPNFSDNVYTAGKDTLRIHDAPSPSGVIINCTNPKEISPMTQSETDEQYRLRIIKAIRVATTSTAEAIRFAGLSIAGVRDIRIRQTPYGLGSFEAVIVPERETTVADIVSRARAAMDEVRPVGVRMYTTTPEAMPVDMEITIVAPLVEPTIQNALANRVNIAVSRYLNSLLPGSPLVYNQMIVMINDASEYIRDVAVNRLSVGGREIMRRNYSPAETEQLVYGDITVNVAQS